MLLLQEIGKLDGVPRGGQLHAAEGASTGIFVPDEMISFTRNVVAEKRFTAVQLHDVACLSIHMPHVTGAASVDRAEKLLRAVETCLRNWKRRKRPPRHTHTSQHV